jgi:serine/threonine protein phosphatase 1
MPQASGPKPKRWVIPDIHGCKKTLQALFEHYIAPSKEDELYFLGDYIDRGPDSRGVIDFIMDLQQKGYQVHLLKGNHEESCVTAYREEYNVKSFMGIRGTNMAKRAWRQYGGKETMKSFGITDLRKMPRKYIDWMDALPTYIELDDFVMVHAGINFSNENPFEDEHSLMWIREFIPQPEKIGGRTIIHGHVSIGLETIFMLRDQHRQNKYIDLDNGIYMTDRQGYGNLVALELNTMELYTQYNLDM